ncbi:MAG: hypothetical protein EBX40_01370 [Gammaproteobacteria bacterium]|nr:hypothetical protein [Gammaproteobacteria bacterium]
MNALLKKVGQKLLGIGVVLSPVLAYADDPSPTTPATPETLVTNDFPTNQLLFDLVGNVGYGVWFTIKIALAVSGFAGIVLMIIGLHKMRMHSHDMQGTSGHGRHGIVHFLVGAALFSVPVVAMLIGSSLFDNPLAFLPSEGAVFTEISEQS